MGISKFDELFNNQDYRSLKEKQKKLYSLTLAVERKKNLYAELEARYRAQMDEVARTVDEMERSISPSAKEAEELIEDLKSSLREVSENVRSLKKEIMINRMRSQSGEYDNASYVAQRDEMCRALSSESANESWIQDGLAFLRRVVNRQGGDELRVAGEKSGKEKIVRTQKLSAEALVEKEFGHDEVKFGQPEAKKAPERASEPALKTPPTPVPSTPPQNGAKDFDGDKTMSIPEEMVGSDPQRLLEPALRVQKGDSWERYPLKKNRDLNIGNVRNPENDICLYDTQVSRRHAKIVYDNVTESWFYVDMGSTNGSSLNGKPLNPHDPALLKNNDNIMVGDTKVAVYIP
ncbi:MAG: FHA domain-containing protein [Nitrospinae bacterium]|nr:FHA domain-containing protein [Nitrospinota bacterium]